MGSARPYRARPGRNDRAMALTRRNALFAGHEVGAENWALLASLLGTCKSKSVGPAAYVADTLQAITDDHRGAASTNSCPGASLWPPHRQAMPRRGPAKRLPGIGPCRSKAWPSRRIPIGGGLHTSDHTCGRLIRWPGTTLEIRPRRRTRPHVHHGALPAPATLGLHHVVDRARREGGEALERSPPPASRCAAVRPSAAVRPTAPRSVDRRARDTRSPSDAAWGGRAAAHPASRSAAAQANAP